MVKLEYCREAYIILIDLFEEHCLEYFNKVEELAIVTTSQP